MLTRVWTCSTIDGITMIRLAKITTMRATNTTAMLALRGILLETRLIIGFKPNDKIAATTTISTVSGIRRTTRMAQKKSIRMTAGRTKVRKDSGAFSRSAINHRPSLSSWPRIKTARSLNARANCAVLGIFAEGVDKIHSLILLNPGPTRNAETYVRTLTSPFDFYCISGTGSATPQEEPRHPLLGSCILSG